MRGEISLFKMNIALALEEKIGYPNGLQLIFPETKGQNTRMIYLYAELAKVNIGRCSGCQLNVPSMSLKFIILFCSAFAPVLPPFHKSVCGKDSPSKL